MRILTDNDVSIFGDGGWLTCRICGWEWADNDFVLDDHHITTHNLQLVAEGIADWRWYQRVRVLK